MLKWHERSSEHKSLLQIFRSKIPDLCIDAVLEVGSRAKGESNYLSDHDFRVYAHSPSMIIVNPTDINSDILEVNETKVDFDLIDIYKSTPYTVSQSLTSDFLEAWNGKFQRKCDIILVDTHSLLWDLALETAFSAFRTHWYLYTSLIVYEKENLISSLRTDILANRYFHWFPTITLQMSRYMRRKKISELYNSLLISDINNCDDKVDKWIKWSLNYIRFAIATWALAKHGNYIYKKDDVLKFASANCPQDYLEFIQWLYLVKCDPVSTKREIAYFTLNKHTLIRKVDHQNNILSKLLNYIYEKTSQLKPPLEQERRYHNAIELLKTASNWIQIPEVPITKLVDKSFFNSKIVFKHFYCNE